MAKRTDQGRLFGYQDALEVIRTQNPWHTTGRVPDRLAHRVERSLARGLWRRLIADEPHRFHMVLGPRRVGKTTVMYQTVRALLRARVARDRVWWLRLDHPVLMRHSLGDLVKLVLSTGEYRHESPLYLFIDELTYASEWDLWLKTFYDDGWPIRLVGTSSAVAALRDRRMESGVGRWEEQYLTAYNFVEYGELTGVSLARVEAQGDLYETVRWFLEHMGDAPSFEHEIRRYLLTGGFPELLTALSGKESDEEIVIESQRTLRTDAVERAVYKDIPQSFSIDNPAVLERLLYVLAANFTGILSPTNLCRELDHLTQPTFDRYLHYLQSAYIIFTLQNYAGNESSRQRRGRKLYFSDTAVRNAALQQGVMAVKDSSEYGRMLENAVAAHFWGYALHGQCRCYYWREGKDEVDFVLDHPAGPMAIEVGSGSGHHLSGLRALESQSEKFGGRTLLATLHRPERMSRREHPHRISIGGLLLCISAESERAVRANIGLRDPLEGGLDDDA